MNEATLTAILSRLTIIEARLAALQRPAQAEAERLAPLLAAIAARFGDATWTSGELFDCAGGSRELAGLLEHFSGARELGRLLAKVAGTDVSGLIVERVGTDHGVAVWGVRRVSDPF